MIGPTHRRRSRRLASLALLFAIGSQTVLACDGSDAREDLFGTFDGAAPDGGWSDGSVPTDASSLEAAPSDAISDVASPSHLVVTAHPKELVVARGSSTSFEIELSNIDERNVEIFIENAPPGLEFSGLSIDTTPSRTVTVLAHETVLPGRYPIVVRARSGERSASAIVDIEVREHSAYALTVVPDSVWAAQGDSLSVAVNIAPSARATDSLSLTLDNAPAGVVMSPATVEPGSSSAILNLATVADEPLDDTIPLTVSLVGSPSNVTAPLTLHLTHRPGTIDARFGVRGRRDFAASTAVFEADGAVVGAAVPSTGKLRLTRVLPSGAVDTSFGVAGVLESAIPKILFVPTSILPLSTGQFVVLGEILPSVPETPRVVAAMRVSKTGTLDTTFGTAGVATFSQLDRLSSAITIGSKTVIAGSLGGAGRILRVDADGALDPSFGNGGSLVGVPGAVVSESNGKLIVAGHTPLGGPSNTAVVMRLDPSGATDTTFGNGGITTVNVQNFNFPTRVLEQSDGKLVVVGRTLATPPYTRCFVARLTVDGHADSTFGVAGATSFGEGLGFNCSDVAEQQDGKLVVSGVSETNRAGAMTRLHTDGTVDTAFNAGLVIVSMVDDVAVHVRDDGRILATQGGIVQGFWP